jgi:hypothetical protein
MRNIKIKSPSKAYKPIGACIAVFSPKKLFHGFSRETAVYWLYKSSDREKMWQVVFSSERGVAECELHVERKQNVRN